MLNDLNILSLSLVDELNKDIQILTQVIKKNNQKDLNELIDKLQKELRELEIIEYCKSLQSWSLNKENKPLFKEVKSHV